MISNPETEINPTIELKLDDLISSVNHGGYYSYHGSLTTPSKESFMFDIILIDIYVLF